MLVVYDELHRRARDVEVLDLDAARAWLYAALRGTAPS